MMRALFTLALIPMITACMAPTGGSDQLELANMRPWNIVPASSAARLAGMFERVCLDGPARPEAAARLLRSAEYVEVPSRAPRAIRSFLVDDSRPAVMLATDGTACAVAAQARTGQTERIRGLVAQKYPAARALSPAGTGPTVDEGWSLGAGQGIVLLRRVIRPGRPSELIVIHQRDPGVEAGLAITSRPV